MLSANFLRCRFQLLGSFQYFIDRSLQIKGLLGNVVVLSFHDLAETFDGIGNLDVASRAARELFGNVEGLREESLNLAGASDGHLLIFAQFIDAENRDD